MLVDPEGSIGLPLMRLIRGLVFATRSWVNVDKGGGSGCWRWLGLYQNPGHQRPPARDQLAS